MLCLLASASAGADAPRGEGPSWEISQGPLAEALLRFAATAHVSIKFTPGQVDGKSSAGLHGRFPVADALALLLQGTGLQARQDSNGDFSLAPASAQPAVTDAGRTAGTAAAKPKPGNQDHSDPGLPLRLSHSLDPVTITAPRVRDEEPFLADRSRTRPGEDVPLIDVPQSVLVLTRSFIESRQAPSVVDLLRYAGDVGFADEPQFRRTPYIRGGFGAPVLIDGLRDSGSPLIGGIGLRLPVAALESVEVLAGPASDLSGVMPPGGTIALNLKQPGPVGLRRLAAEIGSLGYRGVSVDLADALSDQPGLAYRLVGSAEQSRQTWDGHRGERDAYLAPSLRLRAGDAELQAGLEYQRSRSAQQAFTVADERGILAIPKPIGSSEDHLDVERTAFHAHLSVPLGRAVQLDARLRVDELDSHFRYYFLTVSPLQLNNGNASLFTPKRENYRTRSTTASVTLSGSARTWDVGHDWRIGAAQGRGQARFDSATSLSNLTPIDFYQASAVLPPVTDETVLPLLQRFPSIETGIRSLTVQDTLRRGPLALMLGATHVGADTATADSELLFGGASSTSQGSRKAAAAGLANLGVLYKFRDDLSGYLVRLRSFSPQYETLLQDGSPAPPSRGETDELGLKAGDASGQLLFSAAAFRIHASNLLVLDAATGTAGLVPERTSHGVELSLAGRALPGLQVAGSYAYTAPGPFGALLSAFPVHKFSLWLNGEQAASNGLRWGWSGGLRARTSYRGADGKPAGFPVPGQGIVDVGLQLSGSDWKARLGIKNVFDHRDYADQASVGTIAAYPGRLARATWNQDF